MRVATLLSIFGFFISHISFGQVEKRLLIEADSLYAAGAKLSNPSDVNDRNLMVKALYRLDRNDEARRGKLFLESAAVYGSRLLENEN